MRICAIALWLLILAYAAALLLLLTGTYGWFGNEKDPLSGIFLLPLGLPWNMMLGKTSDSIRPWLAAAAPLLNIALLWIFCRIMRR